MAEIAASIIGITTFAVKLTTALYEFGENVSGAREQTDYIARHVSFYSDTLQLLAFKVEEDEPIHSHRALDLVCDIYDESHSLFRKVKDMLPGRHERISLLDKIKWNFRKKKVELIVSQIEYLKSSVSLLVAVLYAGKTIRRHRRTRRSKKAKADVETQCARVQNAILEQLNATTAKEQLEAEVEQEEEEQLARVADRQLLAKSSMTKTHLQSSSELVQYKQSLSSNNHGSEERALILSTSVELLRTLLDRWTTLANESHHNQDASSPERDLNPESSRDTIRNVKVQLQEGLMDEVPKGSEDDDSHLREKQAGERTMCELQDMVESLRKENRELLTRIGVREELSPPDIVRQLRAADRDTEATVNSPEDVTRDPRRTRKLALNYRSFQDLEFVLDPLARRRPAELLLQKIYYDHLDLLVRCFKFQMDLPENRTQRYKECNKLGVDIVNNIQKAENMGRLGDRDGSLRKALLYTAKDLLWEIEHTNMSNQPRFSEHMHHVRHWGVRRQLADLIQIPPQPQTKAKPDHPKYKTTGKPTAKSEFPETNQAPTKNLEARTRLGRAWEAAIRASERLPLEEEIAPASTGPRYLAHRSTRPDIRRAISYETETETESEPEAASFGERPQESKARQRDRKKQQGSNDESSGPHEDEITPVSEDSPKNADLTGFERASASKNDASRAKNTRPALDRKGKSGSANWGFWAEEWQGWGAKALDPDEDELASVSKDFPENSDPTWAGRPSASKSDTAKDETSKSNTVRPALDPKGKSPSATLGFGAGEKQDRGDESLDPREDEPASVSRDFPKTPDPTGVGRPSAWKPVPSRVKNTRPALDRRGKSGSAVWGFWGDVPLPTRKVQPRDPARGQDIGLSGWGSKR